MKTMNKMYKLLCRGVRCGIALFLCLIMCVCSLTLTIFAQDASSNPITENVELPSELPLEEGDFTLSALSTMKVEDVKLPETITLAEALEKEHVNRLYAQEKNLNTAIFQNRSGTKTAYVFDKPIKYVNETGETKDIDTSISSTKLSGYLYAMTENSIQSYFGATTDKGVMFRFKEFSFSIIPEGSQIVSRAVLGENNREITYYNAFGANTAIRYSTQLTGVKEDIILSSDVGKYSFRFLLTTVGISPVKLGNGHWGLADGEGTPIIDFGSIVINDSAGKQVWGEMSVIPRSSGGYIVEITAPKEFLQSSETVYPVYIDPSVTTVEGGGSYVSIHDYGIYTDQMYYNDGNILPNQHFVNASYGKVIYKLADFYESGGLFKNYDDYEIGKVTFRVYSYSTFNSVIKANPMNSACADNERLYLSQSLFNDYSTKNSSSASKSVSVNGTLSFDITEIARGWARYNKSISREVYENPANGFVLSKGGSGDIYLASTEASGNANLSYIVDYSLYDGIYYIKNKASSTYLKTGNTLNQTSDSYPLSCSSGRNYQCSFVVKYVGDQK